MASEKQVAYIQNLIEKMRFKNHPMRRLDTVQQKQEMIRTLGLEKFDTEDMTDNEIDDRFDEIDAMSRDDVLAQYEATIEELANRNWATVDGQTASRAIDSLKRHQLPS